MARPVETTARPLRLTCQFLPAYDDQPLVHPDSLAAEALVDTLLDFARLDEIAKCESASFATAKPFPHIVIDDFLTPATAETVLGEFTSTQVGWDYYHHYNEKKQALTHVAGMGQTTQDLVACLHSRRFLSFMERLTGIDGLLADPDLDGAGLHKTLAGGFLNMHTDFLSHTEKSHWSRQFNLLVFFNKDWKPEWKGALEFWNADLSSRVRSITPSFNRCVIFHTREISYHGHPEKLACPAGVERKSLALYYYRDEGRSLNLRPTSYRAIAGDSAYRRLLIATDSLLLRAYSLLKRYTRISDGLVSRILKRF